MSSWRRVDWREVYSNLTRGHYDAGVDEDVEAAPAVDDFGDGLVEVIGAAGVEAA